MFRSCVDTPADCPTAAKTDPAGTLASYRGTWEPGCKSTATLPMAYFVHRRICLTAIPSEIGAAPLELGMRVGGGCGTRELREDDGSMGRFDSE